MKSFVNFTDHLINYGTDRAIQTNKIYVNRNNRGLYEFTHYHVYKGGYKSNIRALRSNIINRSLSPFDKIVNLSMHSGLRHRSYIAALNAFKKFIYILKFEKDDNQIEYLSSKYLDFILVRSIKKKNAIGINDLLDELIQGASPLFALKTQKIQIKKRSKKNQRHKIRVVYVKPRSRSLVALKWFTNGAHWFSGDNWESQLFKAILNVFLSGPNSYINQKKLKIYNQMVRTFKSRK